MKAIILAAGIGQRLDGGPDRRPKALLEFGAATLLERHLRLLRGFGIVEIAVTVGYRADLVAAEVGRLGFGGTVRLIENPHYRDGSVVSLWAAREILASGAPILLMDADVLYDHRLMVRLLDSPMDNRLLVDRNVEPGDEPVKVCIRDGRIVDFRKRPRADCDWYGESVGFFRFSPAAARELAGRAADYVGDGAQRLMEYEETIRDMILASPPGAFGFEDITGLPWVEMDFPEDVRYARDVVFPRLIDKDVSGLRFASLRNAPKMARP